MKDVQIYSVRKLLNYLELCTRLKKSWSVTIMCNNEDYWPLLFAAFTH